MNEVTIADHKLCLSNTIIATYAVAQATLTPIKHMWSAEDLIVFQ